MNLSDLRVFVSVAQRPSLAHAALELHLTPSAVSKALRRLEESLCTPLFGRTARQLALNAAGQRLLPRARSLLALAGQARDEAMGEHATVDCRLGGPALLLWRHAQAASHALAGWPSAVLRMEPMFETDALAALARGDINAAIVTGEAIAGRPAQWSATWTATALGQLELRLVAGRTHPLVGGSKASVVRKTSAQVLAHDFACPPHSLFCGMQRGTRSDGWRDDLLPRTIRYWTDDLQLLLGFVRAGTALAYLPDMALAEPGIVRVELSDQAFSCSEQAWLVWDAASAPAWQHALAEALAAGT